MPANLLEKPAEIEEMSRKVSKSETVQRTVSQSRDEAVQPQPDRSRLRKIFEGHEEFLGYTPD